MKRAGRGVASGLVGTMAAALSLAVGGGASAQAPDGDAAGRTLAPFAACRAIADDARRLACFDKAASDLQSAVERKDVTIVDRQEIRRARRSLFGFTLPSFSFLGGGDGAKDDPEDKAPEFQEINAKVKSSRQSGYGRYEVVLEDGAVWQTTENLPGPPRAGADVRIRRGALNTYFMRVNGRSVRALRLR